MSTKRLKPECVKTMPEPPNTQSCTGNHRETDSRKEPGGDLSSEQLQQTLEGKVAEKVWAVAFLSQLHESVSRGHCGTI